MKIAVTGASGFIGKHLMKSLREQGHTALGFVRRPQSPDDRPFDLEDVGASEQSLAAVDVVVHAAAYLPKNYADPTEAKRCLDLNALATLDLLQAATRKGVSRFVYFSSNVYRQSAAPVREDAPTYPVTHAPYYMTSKLAGEVWVEHHGRTTSLETASLRVASVYGPGLGRGMISTFTENLLAGRAVTLKDGGRFRSDLVFVDDVVALAVAAATRGGRGIFNAGSGTTSSALEIATALARITGASAGLVQVEPVGDGAPPLGFSPLDVTRAREELGYVPTVLEAALERYVEWHQTQMAR